MEHPQNLGNEPYSKSSNSGDSASSNLPKINFYFLTLFPELFPGVLNASLLGKAQKKGLVSYQLVQIRNFSTDKHRTVDDTPYGGGEGMLLKPDVLHSAWRSVVPETSHQQESLSKKKETITVLLSPQGRLLTQEFAKELSSYQKIVFVCGHYEGVDDRFTQLCVDEELSIGDYVLTGGELPALVAADVITRLIPGVVGNSRSLSEDSLENGLLKYPQYTRPPVFEGMGVPDVLLQGNHKAIESWRESQRREKTQKKRPDLWQKFIEESDGEC
jgi:tRNA (guanine37-N1)-methyltransferase